MGKEMTVANRPIYVISDLHIGGRGERDNFGCAGSSRPEELNRFLDHVEANGGELIIIGDLFEFWQANLSYVLTQEDNAKLIDRLGRMEAVYVLGNHDVDLLHFIDKKYLAPRFFSRMTGRFTRQIGDRTFRFMHGHEIDPANKGDAPGIGRVAAILAGLGEDLNGSPFLEDGRTVESYLMGLVTRALGLWRWLVKWFKCRISGGPESVKDQLTPNQAPKRADKMVDLYQKEMEAEGCDVAIVGHTHKPGWIGEWYYNSGSWATTNNNVIQIDSDGGVTVGEWLDGKFRPFEQNPLMDLECRLQSE